MSSQICLFFLGFDGNCRWGDECKFQHVPADSLSDEELRYHLEYGTKVLEGHLKKNGLYPSCTKLKRQKAKIMAKRKMRRMLENAGKKQNGRINSNGTFSEDEVTDYSNDESC
ncbi:hypothetical protein MHBO_000338 [Bonamia ostreae]|uniref:C3H1-type domain-containing protein n=1 Tax=Bonamia ostreae TaxID=126728 RepID=A0ABV2AFA3_9EUKA